MNIHALEPDEILFAGDWHGYLGQAVAALDYAQLHDIQVIIQLGDFGFWKDNHSQKFLNGLNKQLTLRDQYLFFVDGNHEDFSYLYSHPLAEDGTRPVRERIFHLPRGFRFTWLDISFLAVGGAYSIDRKFRTFNKDYFAEECVSPQEMQDAVTPGQVDVLLMHDSPYGAPNDVTDNPLAQHNAARFYDIDHLEGANNHRKILAPLLETNPVITLHGHYHDRWIKDYVLPSGQRSSIICLDEGSRGVERNTITTTLTTLQIMKYDYRKQND